MALGTGIELDEQTRVFFENAQMAGLPVPVDFPSPAKARKDAVELSTQILSSWKTLFQILEIHEATIRKRWAKKTHSQRTKIFLSVRPNIALSHRPDFDRTLKRPISSQGASERDCFLWPYINVEDLVQGQLFLLFINSRGRNPPSSFAHVDFEACHLGLVSGKVVPAFLNGYTVYLDGNTPRSYGRLIAWADDDRAFDDMTSGWASNPGEALLVFEIQKGTMDFLVKCCYAILHDINPASLLAPDTPIQPEPPTLSREQGEWPTMATMLTEAPYRAPANLDFGHLAAVLQARRSTAEDHIWALREDPGYFLDFVREASEHRLEVLPDIYGKQHPHLYDNLFWARVFRPVIWRAYVSLLLWDSLAKQAAELRRLKDKYRTVISHDEQLPLEFLRAIILFQHTLTETSKFWLDGLQGIAASPPLRSGWVRMPHVNGSTRMSAAHKPSKDADFLLHLIVILLEENQRFLHRLPDIMDELEKFIHKNRDQKERFSRSILDVLSDLGLVAGAIHQVTLYQPWASTFEYVAARNQQHIEQGFLAVLKSQTKLEDSLKDVDLQKLNLPDPLDGRFVYPSHKRRTEQHVASMRRAEQNLDSFWKLIDEFYKSRTGSSFDESFKGLFHSTRVLERTPEWIPPLVAQLEEKSKPADLRNIFYEAMGVLLLATAPEDSSIPTTQKLKDCMNEGVVPPKKPLNSPIMVGKRAYKVLASLFHSPDMEAQQNEIPWTDFLSAMSAAGLSPAKLHGSVWQFTPKKMELERSIQFHEPHPHRKIPFNMARRIGRRLYRAYGWHAGLITLRGQPN
ncbi:hypothetical protein FQN57_005847 [Myotisia sp. PD_48]|nr:hypothetical protein FQN57_005847 [Myotisia sp. PD_48]